MEQQIIATNLLVTPSGCRCTKAGPSVPVSPVDTASTAAEATQSGTAAPVEASTG
jgi:hypothetical protein